MLGIVCFFRGIAAKAKEKKDNDLLLRNPQAWHMQKLLELEKKHQNIKTAAGAATTAAKWWWGKK